MKKFLKVTALLLLSAVIVTEVILRTFFYEPLKQRHYPVIYQEDSVLYYKHIPNARTRIAVPSIDKNVVLNNHGFVGQDFSTKKADGVFRIAVVGNSITEGIWLQGDPFAIHLQHLFDSAGYRNVEVVNCAIGGTTKSEKNLKLITNEVLGYSPDLILANIEIPFGNDTEARINYKGFAVTYRYGSSVSKQQALQVVDSYDDSFLIKLYDLSFIVRAVAKKYCETNNDPTAYYLRQYAQRRIDSPDIIHYYYSFDSSVKLLKELRQTIEVNNSKLVLYEYEKTPLYTDSLKSEGFDVVSLGIGYVDHYFHRYDRHYNELAHRFFAKQFFQQLSSRIKK